MYDDKDYGYNWIGLFIKIIIIVLVILLGIWIFSKLFVGYSDSDLKSDMKAMKTAGQTYFTTDKVPQEVGDSTKVTLDELIDAKIIKSKTISSCDKNKSTEKVTKYQNYYTLKIELYCGKKEASETIKFTPSKGKNSSSSENKTTKSENKTKTENKTSTKENKTETGGNTGGDNGDAGKTTGGKTLYYEYAKIKYKTVTNQYSSYCAGKQESKQYYSVSYIHTSDFKARNFAGGTWPGYEVEMRNLPSTKKNLTITNVSTFSDINSFNAYINSKSKGDLVKPGSTSYGTSYSASVYQAYSFTNINPSVTLTSGNNVFIQVYVKSKSTYTSYQDMIFIPVKFTAVYTVPNTNSCITDLTSNSGKYSNYFVTKTWTSTNTVENGIDSSNTKWSSEKSLSGYKQTGKTEYR